MCKDSTVIEQYLNTVFLKMILWSLDISLAVLEDFKNHHYSRYV